MSGDYLAELQKMRRKQRELQGVVKEEIDRAERPHLDAAEQARAAVQAHYQPLLVGIKRVIKDLEDAYDAALVEAAMAGTWNGYKVGTVFNQMSTGRFGTRPPIPTGKRGVLEIWTADSVCPSGQCAPPIGRYVMRFLKKDGTPSKRIDYNPYKSEWQLVE